MDLLPRHMMPLLQEAADGFRVVVVNGPRQVGKSTLLGLFAEKIDGELLSLDDRTTLRTARTDPSGLVVDRDRPLLLDEIQRGGDPLVLAVKAEVDQHPNRVGWFVMSGSSRFLTVPKLSESLAGRVRIIDLWPLSQGELERRIDNLVDLLFDPTADIQKLDLPAITRAGFFERVVLGGFPSVHQLRTARLRNAWFDDYVTTLVERDLEEIRRIRQVGEMLELVRLVAAWTAQELNVATLARNAGLAEETAREYLSLLEVIYVHRLVPSWSASQIPRTIRRPKLHVVDSGLACNALGLGVDALARPGAEAAGPMMETFVVGELSKQLGWCDTRADLRHLRDRDGREVDMVLTARDGRVVAIEVKAARDVDEHDVRWLAWLRDRLGDRFVRGIVLHLGPRPTPFGDRITALPVTALWAET